MKSRWVRWGLILGLSGLLSYTRAADDSQAVPADARLLIEEMLDRAVTDPEAQVATKLWDTFASADEVLADWILQDLGIRVGAELLTQTNSRARVHALLTPHAPTQDAKIASALSAYRQACQNRRTQRLAALQERFPRWVYARHAVMGGSHYAYTEGLSDAQAERTFIKGSSLCLAEWRDGLWQENVLLNSPEGVIRDVDVDFSGERILFSHKKSNLEDDFHLYEMTFATRAIRQLTDGLGVADYEGCYLPDNRIIFNSTRCTQIVDCWWTEVSNLYRCEEDGSHILRLTFDQVHDNYPTIAGDGTILYTRWEYNDRSQMFPQPLFQMSADGTQQRAVYGENSWFPTTIIHARAISGSRRIFAVATGHHSLQAGDLIQIDPARGRQEAEGVRLVAPLRKTEAVKIDAYGQEGPLFLYPYPLDQTSLVVTACPEGWLRKEGHVQRNRQAPFGLYWMDVEGHRELLTTRKGYPCGRAVPLCARVRPPQRPDHVDYTCTKGTFYVQDVYVGEPMVGVKRGTVKTLRVLSLDYRMAGIGHNKNSGPGGGALVSTPISISHGAWDPKIVVGDAPVYADGSVFFSVSTRQPLYFMLLDDQGRMIQTMRSWTTLQPGENASCVGCHESKNSVPLAAKRPTLALAAGAAELRLMNGPQRGFSFVKEVQPILDRRCVSCHNGKDDKKPDLTGLPVVDGVAKRRWTRSYLALTHSKTEKMWPSGEAYAGKPDHPVLNWITAGSTVKLIPPYFKGSNTSKLFTLLDQGHGKGMTPNEKAILALWVDLGVPFCGDYTEAAEWTKEEWAKHKRYKEKRDRADAEDRATLEALRRAS